MIRLRKYIAFLLFGIFFFPILFQSIHIVWHHSHGYKCEHNLCHHTIVDNDLQPNNLNVSKKEKICPICEYQFPINDLPKTSFFSSVMPAYACVYSEIAEDNQYKQLHTVKSPRGPPVHLS